ncbi:hypothetical protein ES705_38198 [subsurface metagenome]
MPKETLSPPCGQLLRASCSWFRECNSPLCPLDPDLEQRHPPKTTPFCYWYVKAATLDGAFKVPSHIYDNLMRYILHLLQLHGPPRDLIQNHPYTHKAPPRIDDLSRVKGIV